MAIDAIKTTSASGYQGSVSQKTESVRNTETAANTSAEKRSPENNMSVSTEAVSQSIGQTETQDENASEKQNEAIHKAVDKINKSASHTEAVFGIHEETNRVTIKIVDKDTKKVVKEFPPEKTLDMIAKAWELAGLMVDEKR